MSDFFDWLLAAVWPLAKKVLSMLGMGWLTYEGLGQIAQQLIGEVQTLWGQLSPEVLALASRLGVPQAVGIILGAIVARVTFIALGKLGRIAL